MQQIQQHIAFRLFALLLVASLFTPSALKFAHIFEHHEHVVCIGDDSTHIHQVDLECEFHKFQLNKHFLSTSEIDNWLETPNYQEVSILKYKFLNNHRPLSFSLRGPPVLV